MLSVGIVDANEHASRAYAGQAVSIVANWLRYELERACMQPVPPEEAEVVFLCYSGAIGWTQACRRALKRHCVEPDARKRDRAPYVVTGGPIDALPHVALRIADALAVGEAYEYVRDLLILIKGGSQDLNLRVFTADYPHSIEREEIEPICWDPSAPWLLRSAAEPLATPDTRVDWTVPPIWTDDKVYRVVGSKGCHLKCTFCATSYRQTYRTNPLELRALSQIQGLADRGERVQVLSNDPMNLSWYRKINTRLDSQSFTIAEVLDDENRAALIRQGIRMARFGVEGVSERLRRAYGKPVTNEQVLRIVAELQDAGINTHLFFIAGAPYETAADWQEFREFYQQLCRTVRRGICRVKFTSFLPTPPAPLCRYVPTSPMLDPMVETVGTWISRNSAGRHVQALMGRRGLQHATDIAEQLGVTDSQGQVLLLSHDPVTADLAPTLDHWMRMPHNLIGWPIAPEVRYKASEVYRRRSECSPSA